MNELVLIVDDEEGILTTMAQVLGDQGFRTLTTASGAEALELYREHRPDVVFLDIWLPDKDGLEALQAILELDPGALIVMMSGHGTSSTAVKSIKMGAQDYLEKPLSYDQTVAAVREALETRARRPTAADGGVLEASRHHPVGELEPPPDLPLLVETGRPQLTIAKPSVIYGLGLHSGGRTGMVLQPLPPDSGVHFLTLPAGNVIPAHIRAVAETDYATSITRSGEHIRTVEHLLSALHACGIGNLLVKVHGEIPVLDGSALGFLERIEEIGVIEQDRPVREIVIDRVWEIGNGADKRLTIEPADVFSVSYLLRYPKPIGEQYYDFVMTDCEAYRREIAPARTFGFVRDIKMLNELGLGGGGRLDNFIMVGDDEVVNTELRFADEFVRHKILDIIGDLYLLGYPVRGKVTARLTGHRDNIALQRAILTDLGA
jgi:UDP-3-O-[3-hydroxymyristoyl] N-acetylglucosamine deacetylase